PIRYEGQAPGLIDALRRSALVIATDHSSHTHEEKLQENCWDAISGFAGVEISLPLFLTYGVKAGHFSLEELVRAMCEGPAKVWSLAPRKGYLTVGADAD